MSVFLLELSGLQIASSVRSMIFLYVACLAVPYFATLFLINGTILGKNSLNIKCV